MEAKETPASVEDPVALLARECFGIDYLFPLQRMSIANILDAMETGEEVRQLVLFPTGFGKSLCFQLPALLAPGPTIVVYPLLALMNDQKKSLEKRGIPCAVFRGGMDGDERRASREAVKSGAARIVITNPESLATPPLREFLAGVNVFHMALDEAHCISEWGETFRPSYLKLGECIKEIGPKVVSAFTATASPIVAEAIAGHIFGGRDYALVTADIDKPNIRYSVLSTLSPVHSLLRLVREKEKPLIVFAQSRAGVREICELIKDDTGLDARFYHAGLAREEKNAVEAWFMESADGVLAATCAYGMGVDKRNIRTVIHYREPPSVEAYIQEAGRGGRDGDQAEAILIHPWKSEAQEAERRNVGMGGMIQARPREELLDAGRLRQARREAFLEYATSGSCRRAYLHKLMGSELDSPCSGCDFCDATLPRMPEGLHELKEFFGNKGGRLDTGQSLRLLRQPSIDSLGSIESWIRCGEGRPILPFTPSPPTCAGAGLLAGWNEREARALIRVALEKGILRHGKGPFRKKKIFLVKLEPDGKPAPSPQR